MGVVAVVDRVVVVPVVVVGCVVTGRVVGGAVDGVVPRVVTGGGGADPR